MTKRAQIRCINKDNHQDPHKRITHVGGVNGDGARWKQAAEETIEEIESKEWEFFVSQGGKTVNVVVATHNGRKYLKTENDGDVPDNLLSLPECP